MSAALHLASPDDMARLLPMIEAFHESAVLTVDVAARTAAAKPLLEGSPHGAIWLIGPRAAPVGYIAITFGWSLSSGGLDGRVDEFFIRETVRGRGVGTEVLSALLTELEASGLTALHLDVPNGNERTGRLYKRLGFQTRDKYKTLTWTASPRG